MSPSVLLTTITGSALLTLLMATGAKALRHFSHRQLEVFCRLRRRRELFERILDVHDEAAVAAEQLQVLGIVSLTASCVALVSTQHWIPSIPMLVFSCLLAVLGLFAVTIWIPLAVARHWSGPFLLWTWWLWATLYRFLWLLSLGVELADSLVRRLAGHPDKPEKEEEEEAFEDEIMTIVSAGQREGLLEPDAREMIEGVIELGDTDVCDIMTPRSRVDALDIDLSWPEVLDFVIHSGRTRLPVYQRDLDSIIGVLYVKDLLPELSEAEGGLKRPLRELLRHPYFIPSTIPLDDALQDFLKSRTHLAIVVDEYEAVEGVVTIEDVLEEIVGEIVDESDKEFEDEIHRISPTEFEVLGSVHLDDLRETLEIELPESDDYDTIAGYVIHQLGKIPKQGECVDNDGLRVTVLEADSRRVMRVKLEFMPLESGSH